MGEQAVRQQLRVLFIRLVLLWSAGKRRNLFLDFPFNLFFFRIEFVQPFLSHSPVISIVRVSVHKPRDGVWSIWN